jgi:hypothetical protein
MTRWPRGEAEIEEMIRARELQKVSGAAANGQPLLERASVTLATATRTVPGLLPSLGLF